MFTASSLSDLDYFKKSFCHTLRFKIYTKADILAECDHQNRDDQMDRCIFWLIEFNYVMQNLHVCCNLKDLLLANVNKDPIYKLISTIQGCWCV